MRELTPMLEAKADGVQAIIDTARAAAGPQKVEAGGIYLVATASGDVRQFDLTGPQYRDQPARKTGTTTVRDAAGWLTYYGKHHDEHSEVYADVEALTVTAVLDANTAGEQARWGGHRVVLSLRQTKAWKDWTQRDGKLLDQDTFANFLEDHLADLVEPDAASMLEIAQSIQATTKSTFESGSRLHSGERKLVYTEDTTAKAGGRGELKIPETFKIAVVPFEGADRYSMTARFKYRIERGQLALGFKLEQPEERMAAAFGDVLGRIVESIDQPVMNGTAA